MQDDVGKSDSFSVKEYHYSSKKMFKILWEVSQYRRVSRIHRGTSASKERVFILSVESDDVSFAGYHREVSLII